MYLVLEYGSALGVDEFEASILEADVENGDYFSFDGAAVALEVRRDLFRVVWGFGFGGISLWPQPQILEFNLLLGKQPLNNML